MAVSLCEDALRLTRDPCFTADVELVRGRAHTWLGRLPHAAGELVRAGEAVSGRDQHRAARLYAEAAVPLAMANRQYDMAQVALLSETLEPHGEQTLQTLAMSAVALTLRGDCGPARARLDIGDRGSTADDPVLDLQFRAMLANARIWLEDFDIARVQLGAVLERARETGAASVLALALVVHSELDRWTGNWPAAYADATEALHWAEELRQVTTLGSALIALARIDAARGEIALCHERLDRARQLAVTHGIDSLNVSVPGVMGFAALGVGEFALAAEHLETAADAATRGGLAAPNVVPFGGDLVEAHVRAGHPDRASDALRRLEERAAATGLNHPAAAAARCRGVIADGPDVARTWFGRARAVHARRPMPFEQARTLLCEAETLRRMRQPAAARPLLRQARNAFNLLGALPWAARAERELAATGESGATRADRRVDRLTPQEFQIARSVADGASNSDTAAALFLSQKTVESHLTRIYRKLGVRSRAELARSFTRGGHSRSGELVEHDRGRPAQVARGVEPRAVGECEQPVAQEQRLDGR
jgi:DNA-binding CsgD family transcriptional regulator